MESSRGCRRNWHNNTNADNDNGDGNDIRDNLPENHHNGQSILDSLFDRFGFKSMADADLYQKQIFMRFFNYIKDREMGILMVAEKNAMAEGLARILSNNNFTRRRFYKGLGFDPPIEVMKNYTLPEEKPPFLDVFEFKYNFYGFEACVWMVATSGHIYSHDFGGKLKSPEEAFYSRIYDVSKNQQKCLPILLEKIAEDADAVVLLLDNDLEGEAIGFEVINIVKDVLRIPPGGTVMDIIYRAKFSCAQEANDAMEKLERPNFRGFLAMTAQHILDLIFGKSLTRLQKSTLRFKLPHHNINDLPFGPCQSIALALVVDKFKAQQSYVQEYCIEASITTENGEIVATLDSEVFTDRQLAEELCQKLKTFEFCEVLAETVSVQHSIEPLPGLNTFELLICMSKYYGLGSSEVASIIQCLYDRAFITYPRTESTKYPLMAQELILDVLRTFRHRVSPSFGVTGIQSNMPLNIEAAMSTGIDKSDHPPILPTFKCPNIQRLSPKEALVYSFICCRFLASFMPKYTYFKETTVFGIDDCKFEYSCLKAGDDGFTKVLPKLKVKTVETSSPKFIFGNKFACKVEVKEIPPPKLLAEYELIGDMVSNSVGTDGTVPVHISTLQKTAYLEIDEKTREITPTKLGILLTEYYKSCISEALDPQFRASFIQDINGIATGDRDFVEVFDRNLKKIWKIYQQFGDGFVPLEEDLEKFKECFNELPPPNARKNNISSTESRGTRFHQR